MTPNALKLASRLLAVGAGGHLTKQQFVYTTLRESIIRCELGPGTRLVIDDLAQAVQGQHHPGARGAAPAAVGRAGAQRRARRRDGRADLARLGRSKCSRCSKVSRSSPRASPPSARRAADFETLAGFVAEMDRALEAGSPLHWAEINTRFHLAISRLADMPILHDMMQRAVDYWDRVRRFYFRDVLIHRTRLAQAEHRAMLAQMEARDMPGARADRSASTTAARSRPTWRISRASSITRSGSVTRERCAVRPRRGAQDRGALQASPRRRPGIDLGFDEALLPPAESPLGAAVRRRRRARRQPLLRPADGRLGRHDATASRAT